MKNVIKKFLNKLKVVCVTLLCMAQAAGAEGIQNSTIATGTRNLIEDITAWMIGISIVVTVLMVVYCLIRRNMADEMDHKKWQQRMTVSLVSGIGAIAASSVINILASYYQ
jgi:heme/copper-type cytochrome/quinol oxidase subunit 2